MKNYMAIITVLFFWLAHGTDFFSVNESGFARIQGNSWGWAGIIWIFSTITYIPLDILKFITRYALTGKSWDNLLENKVFKLNKN
uniref:P-type ATPase C-terminal domain-containing protein n=1 Tax=Salix viminalis TaxID=40686 RepID=A0A6N2K119_SALVM